MVGRISPSQSEKRQTKSKTKCKTKQLVVLNTTGNDELKKNMAIQNGNAQKMDATQY